MLQVGAAEVELRLAVGIAAVIDSGTTGRSSSG